MKETIDIISSKDDSEKTYLISKLCYMYYIENLSQDEISKRVFISRSQVSKLITLGKQLGMVHIQVDSPFYHSHVLEDQLLKKYGLLESYIADYEPDNIPDDQKKIVSTIHKVLEKYAKDGDTICVGGGHTMWLTSAQINSLSADNITIVPLTSNYSSIGFNYQVSHVVKNFADNIKAKFCLLNTPFILSSKDLKSQLEQEPSVRDVLKMSQNSNILICTTNKFQSDNLFDKNSTSDLKEILDDKNIVCNIGTSFLNVDGKQIHKEISKQMMGLNIEEIKKIPYRICICAGEGKIKALKALLKSGCINILISNNETSKALLADD